MWCLVTISFHTRGQQKTSYRGSVSGGRCRNKSFTLLIFLPTTTGLFTLSITLCMCVCFGGYLVSSQPNKTASTAQPEQGASNHVRPRHSHTEPRNLLHCISTCSPACPPPSPTPTPHRHFLHSPNSPTNNTCCFGPDGKKKKREGEV